MDNGAGLIGKFTKANAEFVAAIVAIEAVTGKMKPRRKEKAYRRIQVRGQQLVQAGASLSLAAVRRSCLEAAKRDQLQLRRAGECLLAALAFQR